MNAIICGTRDLPVTMNDINSFITECGLWDDITLVVSGVSGNVDMAGIEWATFMNLSTVLLHAEWDEFGKAAGPIRNEQMLKYANVTIAFWDEKSRGTKHMIDISRKKGIPTFVKVMKRGQT